MKVSSLVLVTRLTRAAVPISLGRFSIQIRDVEGHTVSVIVQLNPAGLDARAFASDIARRFTQGTTVAMRNIIMAIENDGYFLLLDMQDEDSEVFCCGDDALPPRQVAQLASQCDHLIEMHEHSGALACALESMRASRDLLVDSVAPMLTNLAIAHLRLGYRGVALVRCSFVHMRFCDREMHELVCRGNDACSAYSADCRRLHSGVCCERHEADHEGHAAQGCSAGCLDPLGAQIRERTARHHAQGKAPQTTNTWRLALNM